MLKLTLRIYGANVSVHEKMRFSKTGIPRMKNVTLIKRRNQDGTFKVMRVTIFT